MFYRRAGTQVLPEIHALEVRLAGIILGERNFLHETFRDLIRIERVELRFRVSAAIEADEMLQLIRQYTCDFQLHAGHVARDDRYSLLAIERQQCAVGHELEHARILRHLHKRRVGLAEHVAAERVQVFFDADEQISVRVGVELEAVQRFKLALCRHRFQREFV